MEQFLRTELLIGKDNLKKLREVSVIVIGFGAVGNFAAKYFHFFLQSSI